LGWSDGGSFIPIPLSMLSSAKQKNPLVPMRDDLDERTNASKSRTESTRKATNLLGGMV
jgi:hypothetical protein